MPYSSVNSFKGHENSSRILKLLFLASGSYRSLWTSLRNVVCLHAITLRSYWVYLMLEFTLISFHSFWLDWILTAPGALWRENQKLERFIIERSHAWGKKILGQLSTFHSKTIFLSWFSGAMPSKRQLWARFINNSYRECINYESFPNDRAERSIKT